MAMLTHLVAYGLRGADEQKLKRRAGTRNRSPRASMTVSSPLVKLLQNRFTFPHEEE